MSGPGNEMMDDGQYRAQKRRLKGTPFTYQLRPETVMGFASAFAL
jgi:hypothetical protein